MQITTCEHRHRRAAVADLVYLLDTWKWFGRHTGYAQLVQGIAPPGCQAQFVGGASGSLWHAAASRLYAYSHQGAWCCAGRDAASEVAFLRQWRQRERAIGHVLYFERHHPLFQEWRRAPAELVATIHHPPDQMRGWHPAVLEDLRRLSSAIVLYRRDLDFFENQIGRGRVRFAHHGVDTGFFQPTGENPPEAPKRLLFVGVNGRNLPMLLRVVDRLSRSHPEMRYDMLVPRLREKPREVLRLSGLRRNGRVAWHSGIGDEELRGLYQRSCLLLLPLEHAGVCNAIVEAMACGLPVVTTDVGGIRDYGGGSVYPLVPPGDDRAMADLVADYASSPAWRSEVGAACRRFAEETLSWPQSRQAHLQAYRDLTA